MPVADEPAVDTVTAGAVPEDAVRVALRLRELRASGGRVLLFVPTTSGDRVEPLVCQITNALEQLQEGPVLVLDLERAASDEPPHTTWPIARTFHAGADGSADAAPPRAPVAFAQPVPASAVAVRFLSSPEFAAVIASARAHYAYVLCWAGAVPDSVDGLVAASQSDGVVLSITAGRTTVSEIQSAQRQLARVRAQVLGFVVQQEEGRS